MKFFNVADLLALCRSKRHIIFTITTLPNLWNYLNCLTYWFSLLCKNINGTIDRNVHNETINNLLFLFFQGTDITEGFHVHHITSLPYEMKKKYFIRNAKKKRNAPFTFHEDGFYLTLKKEFAKILPTLPRQSFNTSKFIADALCFLLFIFSILATRYWSYGVGVLSGIFLGFTTISAHNFVHQKDNFRMYYFQFSTMSVR